METAVCSSLPAPGSAVPLAGVLYPKLLNPEFAALSSAN